MPAKAVLIVVTSHDRIDDHHKTGVWFEEFAVPYHRLREADLEVTVASPRGGETPIDPRSIPEDDRTEHLDEGAIERAHEALRHAVPLREIDADEYDAVFFPGGHGPMYDLARDPVSAQIAVHLHENGKPVVATCHGPAALVNAELPDGTPLVKGRRLTAFTDAEEEEVELADKMPFLLETRLRDLGARFEAAETWNEHVIEDGHLITGQNPQSSAAIADALLRALGTRTKPHTATDAWPEPR